MPLDFYRLQSAFFNSIGDSRFFSAVVTGKKKEKKSYLAGTRNFCVFRHDQSRKLRLYVASRYSAVDACFMPNDNKTTRLRDTGLFDVDAYGIENRAVDEICWGATRRINGRQPVLLNDVNPSSFLAIRNTNGGLLRSDLSASRLDSNISGAKHRMEAENLKRWEIRIQRDGQKER